MTRGFPWGELGIARGADVAAIRRAYAENLKAMDIDRDPDGYARLRQARDAALRQARSAAPPEKTAVDQAEPETGEESIPPVAPLSWAYAAPEIVTEDRGDSPAVMVAAPTTASDRWRGLADGFLEADPASAPGLVVGRIFGAPVLTSEPDAETLRPVQRPEVRLGALLSGNGVAAETPLSDDDEAEARACLRAILDAAATSNLARHNAVEGWLAELMARTWPRCAPLLEDVANAMGWTKSAGKLGESKAVAFLNGRLAGYLFQRDVQQPSHPFHKAWVELSRPGRAGVIRLLPIRANPLKRQIRELLKLIQHQFPEIESFLDPQRVGSWEASMPSGRRYVFRIRWWLLGVFLAFRVLIALGPTTPRLPQPDYITPQAKLDPRISEGLNLAVATAFGPGKTMAWLRARQPDLADWISARAWDQSSSFFDAPEFVNHIDREVRRRVYLAAKAEGGADFDDAMRVRQGVIQAARAAGGATCTEFLGSGWLPADVVQPVDLREREQKLASRLVEKGKLYDLTPGAPARATVPGKLVQQVMAETGFSRERVAKVLTSKSIDADRCTLDESLIKATRAWRGKERTAILRIL